MSEAYAREPLRDADGIPVFSEASAYTENYERIAREHLDNLAQTGHNPWMPEAYWKQLEVSTRELIRKHTAEGRRILDVGVGMGRLLESCPELERFGMDISVDYLARAKSAGIDVCYALVEDMPYREATFDTVVCTDVLEHVLDLNFAISNILNVLKPGGTLIIRVPYREDLSAYLAPDLPFEFVHLRNFDEPGLTLLLGKIFGCEMVESSKAGYLPDENRLDAPTGETKALLAVLPHLEAVAPDLYWDILRRVERPAEINFVVRKPESGTGLPGAAKVEAQPLAASTRTFDRDARLLELQQQVAYLTERYRETETAKRLSELAGKANELEAIRPKLAQCEAERDQLALERDQLAAMLNERLITKLLKKLGGKS